MMCVICSIESHSEYFYMDVVQRREHLVPWLDIASSDEVPTVFHYKVYVKYLSSCI